MASVIVVGRQSRREHPLGGTVTVVGRDAGANLELGDLQVSRRHALLVRARQGFFVKDLGSRNGVLLNHERVPSRQQALLKNGDVLSMGRTTLIFKEVPTGGVQVVELDLDEEDGPPTPTVVQTVAVPRVEAPPLPMRGTPAGAPPPSAPQAATPEPTPPVPRRGRKTPRGRGPTGVDALTLQTLIERTERDRQFFRNLSLVLFCLLITALVLLFAYALFQRNTDTAEAQPPVKPSPSQPSPALAFSLDHEAFAARVHPVLSRHCTECHSQTGKGGSLLIATSDDPQTIADNLAAVRVFLTPGEPEKSPLLLKPLAQDEGGLEHGGGAVLQMASPEWKALREWVTALRSGKPPTAAPEAHIVAPNTAAVGLSLALRGATSRPQNGGKLRYHWSLIETPADSKARLQNDWAPSARLTPDLPGRYAVMLEVHEGEARGTATHSFRVRESERPSKAASPPGASKPAPSPAPSITPPANPDVVQRLLARAATPQDLAAQKKGVAALRAHLLQQEALYARWWSLELDHLGLTQNHRPRGEPWDSLPAKLRSGRFSVLDVYYALLVGQDWSDRYPDAEQGVEVMLDRLLGAEAAKDEELKGRALRLLEGHSERILGTQAEGQVGLVRAVVRSRKAAERLMGRTYFRVRGKRLAAAALRVSTDRFLKDPSSYFSQLVAWGLE